MKKFLKEEALPFIIISILVGVLIAALLAGATFITDKLADRSCQLYQEITGRVTVYSPYDNCYINVHEVWYTLKEYEMTLAAKDSFTMEELQ
jgi:hypothetical protein